MLDYREIVGNDCTNPVMRDLLKWLEEDEESCRVLSQLQEGVDSIVVPTIDTPRKLVTAALFFDDRYVRRHPTTMMTVLKIMEDT